MALAAGVPLALTEKAFWHFNVNGNWFEYGIIQIPARHEFS